MPPDTTSAHCLGSCHCFTCRLLIHLQWQTNLIFTVSPDCTSMLTDTYIQLQTWNCTLALCLWAAGVPSAGRGQLYPGGAKDCPCASGICRSHMCYLTWGAQHCLQGSMAASCEELTVTASLFLSISPFPNKAGVEEVPKHMHQWPRPGRSDFGIKLCEQAYTLIPHFLSNSWEASPPQS